MDTKSCPFCGSVWTQARWIGFVDAPPSGFTPGYYGECTDCGAHTGPCSDIETAKESWNARSSEPRWIPVTNRLPEEEVYVLVWRESGLPYVSRRVDSTYWLGLGKDAKITHWMPLPSPPEE